MLTVHAVDHSAQSISNKIYSRLKIDSQKKTHVILMLSYVVAVDDVVFTVCKLVTANTSDMCKRRIILSLTILK